MPGHARTCPDMPGHARTCPDMRGHARACMGMTCADMLILLRGRLGKRRLYNTQCCTEHMCSELTLATYSWIGGWGSPSLWRLQWRFGPISGSWSDK